MRTQLDNSAIESLLYGARREFLNETAREVIPLAESEAPVGDGPPEQGQRLRDSHEIEGPDSDARLILIVNDKPYAAPVHEGSKPHLIPNAFGYGFTVEHPGNDPDPWMRRAMDRLAQMRAS